QSLAAVAGAKTAPFGTDDVARWMAQAACALAHAHRERILHRDVKPDNLFVTLTKSGERIVKVVDFGLAKCLDGEETTRSAFALGSPHYMSPEQVQGLPLDARSDVWSVGVTMYELLAGRVPFDAPSADLVFTCIVH